ncbi:uncharacterized protein LODBEIA_P09540 [Lodderomyces beijingensis]|uniref:Palmitoyltransferase n=1 Tax=Lodderomyces beijingensis TaxID=1775926 RepID=A0ABP0ZEY3_9ASCO
MLFKFILATIALSTIGTLLLLFGDSPSCRNTPAPKARAHLLNATRGINTAFNYLDKKADGHLIQYLGWAVPVGYLVVISICFQQFLSKTMPLLLPVSLLQLIYILGSMFAIFGTTIACIFISPGEVTRESIKHYPFQPDQLIFFKDAADCRTCRLPKPARSKHCSVCDRCYLLYDHHCVWLNNCIGWRNYKWFVAFLLANINMLCYGGVLCFSALWSQMTNWRDFWRVVTRTTDANKVTGIFVILCVIFSIITTSFTILHLRYIYLGVTTNEVEKWSTIEELIDIGVLYRVSPAIQGENYVEEASFNGQILYISLKDERVVLRGDNLRDHNLTQVLSVVDDIDNVYDKGFWSNLVERCTGV